MAGMHQNKNPFSFRPCRTNSWKTDNVSTLLSLSLLLLLLCTALWYSQEECLVPSARGQRSKRMENSLV